MDIPFAVGDVLEPVTDLITLNNTLANLTLLSSLLSSLTIEKHFPKTSLTFKDEYDYIIVGSGPAGSVMANRLTQKPCVSVLLLEAGEEAPTLSEVPAFTALFLQSDVDWAYKTTPQKYAAFGQEDNTLIWSNGKAIGGGSAMNAMLYVRGNMKNYDQWEEEGAYGWGYKDVLPYFKKLEDNRNIEELDQDFHATGGPMTVEKPRYAPKIQTLIKKALAALGFNQTDANGKMQTGIYDFQAMFRNSRRCSAAKAYLVPAEDRPNLDILKNAFARKILIENRTAYGVEFDYLGKKQRVRAKREVIISSGTIRTPQILMLSGIGPKEQLEKFNIPVVADLPVGKNLQDHYGVLLHYLVRPITSPPVYAKIVNPVNVLEYIGDGSGPLASPFQVLSLAFTDGLDPHANSRDFPRQQLYFIESTVVTTFKKILNMKSEVYEQVYKPYTLKPMYLCFSSLLQPKSRGEITLNSTDPYDQPNINPNYYQDERDLQDVVKGMKICQNVAKTKQMRKVHARPLSTVMPGCEEFLEDDDKYHACFAKSMVNAIYHPVGTARMGRPDDPRSVVDPELRVIGVEGLRIVNGAVMPVIPSGNTNVPIMMIAEKAYDMMKNDVTC